jgi:hypothetical protein
MTSKSDVVERLREAESGIKLEAADEIERLRGDPDRVRSCRRPAQLAALLVALGSRISVSR